MSQHSAFSSSRVKVEYHDPYGVFQTISADIGSRLPLRNLNWKSPNRPLRLIDSLFIDLESADTAGDLHKDNTDGSGVDGRPQSRSARKRDSDSNHPRKERRHQIPGLRQTPYLKVLLLRCDDTDTYKSSSRKEIRDWIKLHTPPSQKTSKSSNQENHDAFEWMIIHVVLPDQERRIVWPDRASSKICTYLKDDFNASSRAAPDRIAQVPSTRISAREDAKLSLSDTTFRQQWNEAWDDALNKAKHLILASFDQRVRQYEEDIKEKGAQRAIPGWNFNTFFVLKEGLARGFESVGLVEDALSGYDELQAELDTAVRNYYLPAANGIQDATIFRASSPEIAAICQTERDALYHAALSSFDEKVLETDRKQYRDLILSSDISVFDFKTYVFARQITMLRRLGTVNRVGQDQKTSFEPKFFCEICQRTSAFIASTGSTLRHEVLNSLASAMGSQSLDSSTLFDLASPFVSAWVHRICITVLNYTDVTDDILLETPLTRPSSAGLQSSDPKDKPLPQWQTSTASPVHIRALLASRRANLFRTAQRALEELAAQRGWRSGWQAALQQLQIVGMTEDQRAKLDLNQQKVPENNKKQHETIQWASQLPASLESQSSFQILDSALSTNALACHIEAGDTHSAQALQLDAALHKFISKDCVAALQDLKRLNNAYGDEAWTVPYTYVLAMLCHCFHESGDNTGYVQSCLKLASRLGKNVPSESLASFVRIPGPSQLLKEAFIRSRSLDDFFELDLCGFVSDVDIRDYIQHHSEGNGISAEIIMNDSSLVGLEFDDIILTLVESGESGTQECRLTSSQGVFAADSTCVIRVQTTDVKLGSFRARQVEIVIGKVRLVHKFLGKDLAAQPHERSHGARPLISSKELRIWLPSYALDTSLQTSEHVDLEEPKTLMLTVHSGRHTPERLTVKLKAGSSGLRIHTAQAKAIDEGISIESTSDAGCFKVVGLARSSYARLRVPFQIDNDLKKIVIRTETSFIENSCVLTLEKSHRITTQLPLGVNVQDIFKTDHLFSKFSVSSSNGMPLCIVDYKLEKIPGFEIAFPKQTSGPHIVFAKQPATLIYRIHRGPPLHQISSAKVKLQLSIVYRCFVDDIVAAANKSLAARLADDSLIQYCGLLQTHVESFLISKFSRQEIDSMALSRHLTMPSYKSLRWEETLACLKREDSLNLQSWLQHWHSNYGDIIISDAESSPHQRSISIPVEIPPMRIVQRAALHLLAQGPIAIRNVGDALPAELEISFTSHWSQRADNAEESFEFSFELESPLDTWIIGGERRGMFRAKEGTRRKFMVLLLPQRSGYLPYPGLDVRLRGFIGEDRPHCELDYQSQGKSVLVLPGIESPTVGVSLGVERKSLLLQLSQ